MLHRRHTKTTLVVNQSSDKVESERGKRSLRIPLPSLDGLGIFVFLVSALLIGESCLLRAFCGACRQQLMNSSLLSRIFSKCQKLNTTRGEILKPDLKSLLRNANVMYPMLSNLALLGRKCRDVPAVHWLQ